jgi:hypothetical protein
MTAKLRGCAAVNKTKEFFANSEFIFKLRPMLQPSWPINIEEIDLTKAKKKMKCDFLLVMYGNHGFINYLINVRFDAGKVLRLVE